MLLVAVPADFRREFGKQMVQDFVTAFRQADHRDAPGFTRLWAYALTDLVRTAAAEWRDAARRRDGPIGRFVCAGALAVSLLTAYLHLRADMDGLSILLLLAGGAVCGVLCPYGAWRWAAILGFGIPFALLTAHGFGPAVFRRGDADLPLPAPLIPGLLGAYTGSVCGHFMPRLRAVLSQGAA